MITKDPRETVSGQYYSGDIWIFIYANNAMIMIKETTVNQSIIPTVS